MERIEKVQRTLKALALIGERAGVALEMWKKGKENQHRLKNVLRDGLRAAKKTFDREVMEKD